VVTNAEDLPGFNEGGFDDVNLHFHGLQIVPHLFYPQGTSEPAAPWITVSPASLNSDQACFCYVFHVPEDHPQGTFFWHIHRHGSAAMQAWQGMVGMLKVGNASSPGGPAHELNMQGVTREEKVVLWELAVNGTQIAPATFHEGQFLDGGAGGLNGGHQVYPVNNGFNETFTMAVNEVTHFRLLCAQTSTGSAVYLQWDTEPYESQNVIPFWVFASDGISYEKAYKKDMIVIGPGQREALLMQFSRPGTVRVMQGVFTDFQGVNQGMFPGSSSQVMATIIVTAPSVSPAVDVDSLTFTPGIPASYTLAASNVQSQFGVKFQVKSDLSKIPMPQYEIDDAPYDSKTVHTTVTAHGAAQWTIASSMNYWHPFHIHVNPFQVKSVNPGYLAGTSLFKQAVIETNTVPPNMWRDTVFIPPLGNTVIWQRFGDGRGTAETGKTVYHCHFLDHEDQGMMANLMIRPSGA